MEKAYKFRIYPNKTQETLLQKTFGCVRFIYNHFLDKRIKAYEQNKKTISYNECSKELTQLKKEKKWLKEPDKSSLQNALKNLDTAYKKINDLLADDEYIISQKSLKLIVKDSKIVLDSFFTVYENITGYQTIIE